MKKSLSLLLAIFMLLTTFNFVNAEEVVPVEKFVVISGRTYLDLEQFSNLGLTSKLEGNKVTLSKDDLKFEFEVGKVTSKVNGVEVYMDRKIVKKDNVVLLPVKFILETMGYSVKWEKGSYKFEKEEFKSYPISYEKKGCKTNITKEPQKVVSASPGYTQNMIELGVLDRLIGQSGYAEDITEAKHIPVVVPSTLSPDIEAIIAAKPDTVFLNSSEKNAKVIEQLNKAGIQVLSEPVQTSQEDSYEQILNMGRVFNREYVARAIISGMKAQIETVKMLTKNLKAPSAYYSVAAGEYGEYTAPKGSYMDLWMSVSGIKNISVINDTWSYTTELLVKQNPEIIYANPYAYETLVNHENYKALSAVKNKKVFAVDSNSMDRPTAKAVRVGLKELIKVAHPEVLKSIEF